MAQDDIARLWLEIGRQRADGVVREQLALLPQFLAARAARKGQPQVQSLLKAAPETLLKELAAAASKSDALIVYGDSWLKYPGCPAQPSSNMSEELVRRGFTVYDAAAYSGARVIDLAKRGNLHRLSGQFQLAASEKARRKAVLLCGGGNDAVGDGRFYDLLNDADSPARGLNDAAVRQRVNSDIQGAYLSILASIDEFGRRYFGQAIPVLTHGYDFPVPDSRGACVVLAGPWLGPYLANRGYSEPAECRRLARELIERLNAMQAGLRALSGLDVSHVSLTGTLSTEEADYQQDWENELHPTLRGFGRITDTFVRNAGL